MSTRHKKEWVSKKMEYKNLLKNDPNNGNIWLDYATFIENESDDPVGLLNALITAQKLLPDKDLRLHTGVAYVDAGENEKGINIIRDVLNQTKSANGFCFLAEAYIKIDNYQDAMIACEEAISLDPKNEEAYYLYGESIRNESSEKAIEFYYKAVIIDPEFQEAWGALGRELISIEGRIQEGIDCLAKAISLDNDDGWSMLYKANGLWKIGKSIEADEAYREAISIFPHYADMYLWYAQFLNAQNRNDEVEEQLKAYNKLKLAE